MMYEVLCVTKAMFLLYFFYFFLVDILCVVGITATATLTLPAQSGERG